jgi:hypothetical protein
MTASGRTTGLIMVGAGLILALGIWGWLIAGLSEDNVGGSGAVLGFVFSLVLIIPLVGGGIYFLVKGSAEAKDIAKVQSQRRLLDIVTTKGSVSVPDLVLDLNTSKEQVQHDLYELVGRGLFSGYVDWEKGMLYSVEASKLQGQKTCPNCGGALELAGKGLIKCPYCGADIAMGG